MLKPKRLLDPAEIAIPTREDDPRYAAELGKLRALQARWDETEARENRARLHWRSQQPAIIRTRGVDAAPKMGVLEVRSFAPGDGVPEDPVCGSGNGCVAALLRRDGILKTRSYVASQGRCLAATAWLVFSSRTARSGSVAMP